MSDLTPSSARIFASFVADEPDAAAQIFHRYLQRLCRLAQTRLAPRLARRVDPEDVVMSAYRSFFLNARAGRFWIQESGDLWALLTKITLRKLYRAAAHHSAGMRSVFRETQPTDSETLHEWVISEQPSAEEAVALADEVESVLRPLSPQHRRIVELRLQGEFMEDIARDVGLSERTVRRILSDLESQIQQRHGLHGNETLRIVSTPDATAPVRPARKENDRAICRIQFEQLLLQKLIGAGGMGKVYRAVSKTTGKLLAVKFLHKALRNRPAMEQRFLSEASIVQRLDHSGIVRIEGIGQTKAGVWFIAMELIEGRNLAEEIADHLPSLNDSVSWISDISDALQHAHQAGVIHCDLKPANVLLTPARRAVVTDFGLARLSGSASSTDVSIAGTAPWMAPEQIDPIFGSIGPWTDVYGLGALFYTILTGQPPFVGPRVADVLAMIVSESPVLPSQLRTEIPTDLEDLCLRCLSKTAQQRPQSPADVCRVLRGKLST